MRRLAEAPGLVALRSALRIGFAGFVAGLAAFASVGSGPVLARIAAAVVPALGAMSVVLAAALPLQLARRFGLSAPPLAAGTLAAFALALARGPREGVAAFFHLLGGSGLFLAIVVSFLVLGASLALRSIAAPNVAALLGPACVAAVFLWLWHGGISLADGLAAALAPLGRLGDSYGALAVIVTVETLLWLVGIHGPAMLAAIVTPVYLVLQGQNSTAFAHGEPLPHIVTTSTFLFIFPGGAGATLALVLLMLRARVRELRRLAAAVVGPALFGVNEPLVFGLPLVFEPVFAVPFVAVPLVLGTTTYAAMASGLVARPAYYIPSSIPPVLNAFLATADWRACVLAAVNLGLAGAIYYPFLLAYERGRA